MPKNIKLLAAFNFLNDFRFYYPVAILYFSQVSGSYALGMSVFSFAMVSSALFEVPTGIYSDFIGRKKTLVWGAFFSLTSVVFYALAASYWWLVVGAVLEGVSRAFYSGNNDALLFDSLREKGKEKAYADYFGKVNSVMFWAAAAVAVLGSVIANFSFRWVMWLSVLPVLLAFLVSLFMAEPKVKSEKSSNVYLHLKEAFLLFKTNYRLRTLSLAKIIGFARGEAGYQFQAAFINTLWPTWAIGFVKLLSNVGAALSSYFSGKVIKKFGAFETLMIGKVYSLVSNVVATIYPSVISPIILASNSIFHGTSSTAQNSLLQQEYSHKQRSTMGSLNSFAGSLVFALVAFGLGLVADKLGPAKALLSLQILAVISLWLTWKTFRYKDV